MPTRFLLALLIALAMGSIVAHAQCHGLDFNLQLCGYGGSTYYLQAGICYRGSISENNPKGSFKYQSTRVDCHSANACSWTCWTDDSCSQGQAECSAGYSELTCSCTNVNTFSWDIRIGGNQIFSWQGNSTAVQQPQGSIAPLQLQPATDITPKEKMGLGER